MLLTTSKRASKALQALSRQLASHLPECRYLPRSERALERLQTLASRAGHDTIIVVSAPQTDRPAPEEKKAPYSGQTKKSPAPPLAIISSRQLGDDASWSWQEKSIALLQVKFGQPMPPHSNEDDPLEFKIAPAPAAQSLSAFLGLCAGKRAPLFAQSTPLTLKATSKKAEIKLSRQLLIQFNYVWC